MPKKTEINPKDNHISFQVGMIINLVGKYVISGRSSWTELL